MKARTISCTFFEVKKIHLPNKNILNIYHRQSTMAGMGCAKINKFRCKLCSQETHPTV